MAFRQLTPKGTAFLKSEEGVIPYVYDDSIYPTRMYKAGEHVGGTLTGGVGHVGPDLQQYIGKTIPQPVINQWLDHDTDVAEQAVDRLVKVRLSDNQWDVLYSFTFNVGVEAFMGSTLLKVVNKGQLSKVPAELAKWNKTTIKDKNGKKRKVTSSGLVHRRALEAAYWIAGTVPSSDTAVLSPPATQVAQPGLPKITPMEGVSAAGTVIGAATGLSSDNPLAWTFAGICALGAILVFGILFRRYVLKK